MLNTWGSRTAKKAAVGVKKNQDKCPHFYRMQDIFFMYGMVYKYIDWIGWLKVSKDL